MTGSAFVPSPLKARLKNGFLAAGILLLLNIGFIAVSHHVGASRPWINLDYAFALVLCAFGFRTLGAALGLLFLLTDTLVLATQLFPFPRISDVLYLLKFSALASSLHLALIVGLAVLIGVKLVTLMLAGNRVTPVVSLIVFNTLVAAAFVLMQFGHNDEHSTTYRKIATPPVASQSSTLFSMRSSLFLDLFDGTGNTLSPGPAGASVAWHDDPPDSAGRSRMLLVVVESWGTTLNADIESALLAPLRKLSTAVFETGTTKFQGFTIEGELRELCKLTPENFNLRDIEAGFETCLPRRLQAAGFKTAAMHGATSLMYDRRHWYPRAGFEEMTFFEDKVWPQRCYSFPGACDLDMLSEVGDFFSQPGKRFMYWLTLNTHAPYDMRDLRFNRFNCTDYGIGDETESCRLLKLQADFFDGLAQQLRTEAMKNVDVIIVGDHTPNIMNLEEKKENFSMDSVPWIRIKTKN